MINSDSITLNQADVIRSRYQIIKQLGKGGFCYTYLAKDLHQHLKPTCVVKQLQLQFHKPSLWADALERFKKEANALKKLGLHPNIPQLFDYLEEKLQFIDGEDLNKETKRQLFDEVKVISLLYQVLEILIFVHQQGVIHRDIKPANLIRSKADGKIVLIDFGAVKKVTTLTLNCNTQQAHTQSIKTIAYSPQEQIRGTPAEGSDIHALGITAIYALTGVSDMSRTSAASKF